MQYTTVNVHHSSVDISPRLNFEIRSNLKKNIVLNNDNFIKLFYANLTTSTENKLKGHV